MSLQFIIDGYNTVRHPRFHAPGKIKDPRRALAAFIADRHLCGSNKNSVLIVFDGYPDASWDRSAREPLEIRFSGPVSADEKIKKLVEASGNPRRIVVVTDDKEIRLCVKAAGATAERVEEFLGRASDLREKAAADVPKPSLTYTQAEHINKELRKLWLR